MKICEIYKYINIRYIFAYAFPMFATSPSTIMEAAPHFCGIHYDGWCGGKHRENTWGYVCVYFAYLNVFPLRDSRSYLISEIRISVQVAIPS